MTRVAHYVFNKLSSADLLQHVRDVGDTMYNRLSAMPDQFPSLLSGPIRGRGLILGLPCKDGDVPGKLVKACRERGLLVLSCGNNTIRFVPSLIVTQQEVDKACDILEGALLSLESTMT